MTASHSGQEYTSTFLGQTTAPLQNPKLTLVLGTEGRDRRGGCLQICRPSRVGSLAPSARAMGQGEFRANQCWFSYTPWISFPVLTPQAYLWEWNEIMNEF